MEQHIRRWAEAARTHMAPYGVQVTGARWYVPKLGGRKRNEVFACLDAGTTNAGFFGREYRNRRRGRLLELAYDVAYSMPEPLNGDQWGLDMRLSLIPNSFVGEPLAVSETASHGVVDVTHDNSVRYYGLEQAIADGEIEPGTMLDVYCRRYGIEDVLVHGGHYISPDRASVDLLEDLLDIRPGLSVLEIGAGVGICGVAASRRGIDDYTFVDLNPEVCRYVQKLTGFRAYCADAMSFIFNRNWDVILMGIPYELNPEFMAKRGNRLAENCDMVIFQSGCRNFFDFEHDWLMGRPSIARWPWYRPEQTLGHHFPHVMEVATDWQLAAIGANNEELYQALRDTQAKRDQLTWHDRRISL